MAVEVSSYKELTQVIREKINLREYMERDGISFKNTNQGGVGLCPFHKEKTPSFNVFNDTQSYYCFGCHKHGSIIDYVMEREGMDFKTAITSLAERFNISLQMSPKEEEFRKNFKKAYKVTEVLGKFFEEEFQRLSNEHPAKKMIIDRGLDCNTVRYGYAPENTNKVIDYLKPYIKKGDFTPKILSELGYLQIGNNNKPYFPIRNRLMFYFQSQKDKIEGFTGRALTEEDTKKRKYVNSNNSIIYQKSKEMYNLNQARKYIQQENSVYLVEGQFDVVAMIEAGYKNTIAVSGTALDKQHIQKLSMIFKDKGTGRYILCLDGDSAGENASRLVFEKNPNIQRNLFITIVPEGKDPCDYLGKNKNNRLNEPVLYIDYIFKKLKKEYVKQKSNDPHEVINEFGKLLSKIPDKLLRNSYIQKLSTFTLVPINIINEIIGGVDAHSIQLLKDLNNTNNIDEVDLEIGNYFDKALAFYVNNRKAIKKVYIEKFPQKYQEVLNKIVDMKVVILDNLDLNNPIISTLNNNIKNLKPYSSIEEDDDIQIHYITLIKFGLKEIEEKKKEQLELLFRQTLENAKTKEEIEQAFSLLNKE